MSEPIICPTCNTNSWYLYKCKDYSETQDILRFECSSCKYTIHSLFIKPVSNLLQKFREQKHTNVIYDGTLVPCPQCNSQTWMLFSHKWIYDDFVGNKHDSESIEVSCTHYYDEHMGCYVANSTDSESNVSVILQLIKDDEKQ